jgi:hypothetical protein
MVTNPKKACTMLRHEYCQMRIVDLHNVLQSLVCVPSRLCLLKGGRLGLDQTEVIW